MDGRVDTRGYLQGRWSSSFSRQQWTLGWGRAGDIQIKPLSEQALGWQYCIPRVYTPISRNSKKAFQSLDMERLQADGFFRQLLLEILEGQISTGTALVRGDAKPRQRKNWSVFIQIFIRQMTWEIHLAGGLIACIFPIRVSLPCDQTHTTNNFYFLDHKPGNWGSHLFIFLMSRLASRKTWLQSSSG